MTPIHRFEAEVTVSATESALMALNRHHSGRESIPLNETPSAALVEATYRLMAARRLKLAFDVFPDGSVRLSRP